VKLQAKVSMVRRFAGNSSEPADSTRTDTYTERRVLQGFCGCSLCHGPQHRTNHVAAMRRRSATGALGGSGQKPFSVLFRHSGNTLDGFARVVLHHCVFLSFKMDVDRHRTSINQGSHTFLKIIFHAFQ